MSNEKRIRDLLARMVSMSPQPPPYPQEIVMTHEDSPTRRNPALIFGVAALAVVALALPLFLWNTQGDPVGAGTTTSTTAPDGASTTTAPGTSTTLPGSTTTSTTPTPPPGEVVATWPVFFVQEPEGSFTQNPAIVPFDVRVYDTEDVPQNITDSPEDLLFNLDLLSFEIPEGFVNAVPAGVEIVGKSFETTDEGVTRAVLDMNEKFIEGAGGLLGDFTMLNQIIFTTLQFEVAEVQFTVGGEPVTEFGSEGLSLVDPVDALTFREELNPIIITEPVLIDDGGNFVVNGVANVFEATVNYRIDGRDEVGHTMASCGTGCWGVFEFTAARPDDIESNWIEVFTLSAQDGSPIHIVRVPLSAATDMRQGAG